MVSVVAVAAHAGVSPATVSRVIAGRVPVAAETRRGFSRRSSNWAIAPTRWRAACARGADAPSRW